MFIKTLRFLKYITKQSSKTRSRTKRKSSFQNNFFYFGKTPEKTLVFLSWIQYKNKKESRTELLKGFLNIDYPNLCNKDYI